MIPTTITKLPKMYLFGTLVKEKSKEPKGGWFQWPRHSIYILWSFYTKQNVSKAALIRVSCSVGWVKGRIKTFPETKFIATLKVSLHCCPLIVVMSPVFRSNKLRNAIGKISENQPGILICNIFLPERPEYNLESSLVFNSNS